VQHAVSNQWDQYRTHLILDYVEDYPVSALQLQPGAKLAQTRRSIDVVAASAAAATDSTDAVAESNSSDSSAVERSSAENVLPSFIIIGAQVRAYIYTSNASDSNTGSTGDNSSSASIQLVSRQ
jgi:hypothetical protein